MKSGAGEPAPPACHLSNGLQVEDDEKVPDIEAEEAVVRIVKVPVTAAVVPDAVSVTPNVADPTPPATSLSSASVSSIKISTLPLLMKIDGRIRAQVLNLATSDYA
jgi:hypothetical protein